MRLATPAGVALRGALLLLPAVPLAAQTAAPPFTETIEVREVEILFDTAVLPPFESLGKKGIEDFAAVEAGAAHPLVGFQAVPREDWIHLLYFDPALADAATRRAAANALARRAESLAGGALVEIVIADPRPRLVSSSRDVEVVRRALAELSAGAASRPGAGTAAEKPATEEARNVQLDRLSAEIGRRAGGGPRSLWLPVSGLTLSPAELERWSRAKKSGDRGEPMARAFGDAGRVLAGYGWVTFPLALREEGEEVSPSEAERRMRVETGGTGDERTTVPMFTVSGRGQPSGAEAEAQLETMMDFTLAPFAELARTSSGTLVGHETRLRTELDQLLDRRRATYRGPRPKPGELIPVEVRWKGGDDRPVPATRLLRSSTPPEVSASRLRLLLAGDSAPKVETIRLRDSKVQSLVPSRDLCFGTGEEKPVRVSIAREKKSGEVALFVGEVRELEVEGGGELCTSLSLPFSADDRRIAWIAEDLDTEAWTGGVEATQ